MARRTWWGYLAATWSSISVKGTERLRQGCRTDLGGHRRDQPSFHLPISMATEKRILPSARQALQPVWRLCFWGMAMEPFRQPGPQPASLPLVPPLMPFLEISPGTANPASRWTAGFLSGYTGYIFWRATAMEHSRLPHFPSPM